MSQASEERHPLGLRILCHPDLARIDDVAPLFDRGREGKAQISRLQPMFRNGDGREKAPLQSARVSRSSLSLEQNGDGSVRFSPDAALNVWLDEQLLVGPLVVAAARLEQGVCLRLGKYILLWLGPVDSEPSSSATRLFGNSIAMRRLRAEIANVADLMVPVILRGETGVGKELVATALHQQSQRCGGPFVPVNMAAIPPSMAASELFGHVKGAFTGAVLSRVGYFAAAHTGTLFLDEIGETASDVQPMLLRALEDNVIQPLGGKPEQIDVRLVAATDSNLESAVAEGRFRAPLLRRFGYELRVPALRQRREDIGGLVLRFLREELDHLGERDRLTPAEPDQSVWLCADVVAALVRHTWPGNVRELRNVVRRMAVNSRGQRRARFDSSWLALMPAHEERATPSEPPHRKVPPHIHAGQLSDEQILHAMAENDFSVGKSAQALKVSRSYLNERVSTIKQLTRSKDLTGADIARALASWGGDGRKAARELRLSYRALQLRLTELNLSIEELAITEK